MAMAVRTYSRWIAAALWLGLCGGLSLAPAAQAAPTLAAEQSSAFAQRMAAWAVGSGDNEDLPFAIIDKNAGMVFVYDAKGKLVGADAALVGFAFGDDSVEGIGDRQLADVKPEEKTTPAGRFVGGYGPAAGHAEDVLWVDYGTAVSLHPVVTANPAEMRVKRLKSPSQYDNRISFGCINVSNEFYEKAVSPTFRKTRGVFYVLPDTKPLADVFPHFAIVMQAEAARQEKMASAEPPKRRRSFWPW